ncbi:DUF368 domain-containing protein [Lignipirellula cremea]|uniref:DUF368 domain-containing protein n=1 Tax=Lignipirellula cremea TaxID=2528010 RepID=A0A518DUP1_9BACT|nr:DUF368 domain-containing protein [Lignipirellula cremea]QDU95538.1 hypothetical protein Pla8534_33530 [Lignipirellula cremea]
MTSNPQPQRTHSDGAQLLRGLCMGLADVVPGVSGGTVALVLGIYPRLIGAISHFDLTFFDHVKNRRWRAAAEHVDLRFLIGLACGIVAGVLAMAMVINRLLVNPHTRPLTFAAFFGMILASGIMVARLIRPHSQTSLLRAIALGIVGAGAAFALTMLKTSNVDPSLPYLFGCGLVAICAMILPGVSGAMMLLMLGVYEYLSDAPHRLLHGEMWAEYSVAIPVFCLGCAIGLIAFSKLLRWLLAHCHTSTMAVLCGFMFGALPKLWPFQLDQTPDQESFKEKIFTPYLPDLFSGEAFGAIGVALIAAGLVFVLDAVQKRSENRAAACCSSPPAQGAATR